MRSLLIRIPSAVILTLLFFSGASRAADWQTYENCHLAEDRYFDGDSFKVATQKNGRTYTYIFRLYGADCAETDLRYPERIAEQAKAFQIPASQVVPWGEKAKHFAESFLAKPFTVYTKKEDARGASSQHRYYAVVVGNDGRNLAETLIEQGLARAYGMFTTWPLNRSYEQMRRDFEHKESQAKADHHGVWGGGRNDDRNSPFSKPLPIERKY